MRMASEERAPLLLLLAGLDVWWLLARCPPFVGGAAGPIVHMQLRGRPAGAQGGHRSRQALPLTGRGFRACLPPPPRLAAAR